MSTHPNAILLLTLTPEDLARKTWRAILDDAGVYKWQEPGIIDEKGQVQIYGKKYYQKIMESDYDQGMQIAAKEGNIVVFDMVTYGYGEVIQWSELEKQKMSLEKWAKNICEKFRCSYEIFITANYW